MQLKYNFKKFELGSVYEIVSEQLESDRMSESYCSDNSLNSLIDENLANSSRVSISTKSSKIIVAED